jgi:chitin disaccharide deacetylase
MNHTLSRKEGNDIFRSQTNRLLGYPDKARLLIVNADDLGMCHSVNEAIFRTLLGGLARSTSLMVPCPWAAHAMQFLHDHPELPFGVHLTVIADSPVYPWRPILSPDQVLSLVDERGFFYTWEDMAALLAGARLDHLEAEFRTQIETVLSAGLQPAHLDWHSLRFGERTDINDLMTWLAIEYGLALRVRGRGWTEKVQRQGLPANDYDFLDSSGIEPADKPARFAQILHDLPPGLSEWAVHPGLGSAELQAIEPEGWLSRKADFEFLMSQAAKDIVESEGIQLIDYRPLQTVWRKYKYPDQLTKEEK